MAKENEKKECCADNKDLNFKAGFNFGFGFWSAALLVSTIVTLIAIVIWYISTLI